MSALTVVEREALGCALPTLRTYAQLQALPPVRWAVKGLLKEQGLGILYGAPGSGKTFLVLDLALHLAAGRDWFGYRTRQARPVVYVALEAGAGIASRLQAWAEAVPGRSIPDNFKVISGDSLDLLDHENVESFAQAVAAEAPGALVIIDTLNRAMPGADENSGQDMSGALAAAQRMADMVGGFVLLVAHTGKDPARGPRGHSSQRGNTDLMIEVVRSGEARTWTANKVKDDRDGDQRSFKLRGVTLGTDEDGDPVTSCFVEWDTVGEAQQAQKAITKGMGANQLQVYQTLVGLLDEEGADVEGRRSVTHAALKRACVAEWTAEGKGLKQAGEAFGDALRSLVSSGRVLRDGTPLRPGLHVSLPAAPRSAGQ